MGQFLAKETNSGPEEATGLGATTAGFFTDTTGFSFSSE
jgi:hypothetical protein